MRTIAFTLLFFLSCYTYAQVGIGTTTPDATLDIEASNMATPASNDGILIPRVDNFPTVNPSANQDGMMVFATGNGTPTKGFYYWDNTTTSWVSVKGADTDADFFEIGTSNPPDAISDDIYTLGKLKIGQNSSASASLNIHDWNGSNSNAFYITRSLNSPSSSGQFSGAYITMNANTTDNYFGVQSLLSGSTQAESANFSALAFGTFNSFTNLFSGSFYSTEGTGRLYGTKVNFMSTVTNTGNKYGFHINIPSSLSGIHYGLYSDVQNSSGYAAYVLGRTSLGNTSANRYVMPASDGTAGQVMTTDGAGNITFEDTISDDADWLETGTTSVANDNNDDIYTLGKVNIGDNVSTSSMLRIYNNTVDTPALSILNTMTQNSNSFGQTNVTNNTTVSGTGTGSITGFSNSTSGTSSALIYNINAQSSVDAGTSNSSHILYRGLFTNTQGDGSRIGSSINFFWNAIGTGVSGSGDKIGYDVDINQNIDGTHYGYLADVRKSTGYAAYFIGRTSLGVGLYNRYLMPENDGNANQVMTTDGSGNVTFQDLPTFTNTDEQDLGSNVITPNEEVEITISNGTNAYINIQDADSDITNEVITAAILNGTDLEITEAGSTTTVDLSSMLDTDWTEVSGGNIERQSGDVYIGDTASTNNALYTSGSIIDWDNTTYSLDLNGFNKLYRLELDGGSSTSPGLAIGDNNTGFYSNSAGTLNHTGNGVSTFNIFSDGEINFRGFNSNYDFVSSNPYNNAGISLGTSLNSIPLLYGYIDNDANEIISEFEVLSNNINFSHSALRAFSDIGDNEVRLAYNSSATNRYAVYAVSPNDFAGYFRGEVQFGTSSTNRYNMPTADGTAGQIMTTDGAGNVTFQNPTVNTDDQQIDTIGLAGTVLGISLEDDGIAPATVDLASINTDDQRIQNFSFNSSTNVLTLEMEDDGQAPQTVDLSSLNPTKSLARITMSADQSLTTSAWQKLNFDTVDFDLNAEFNTTTDVFEVTTTGYYRINASWRSTLTSTSTDAFGIAVVVNGAIERAVNFNNSGNGFIFRSLNRVLDLNAGDTVEIYILPTVPIDVLATDIVTSFEIEQIR